MKFVDKKGDDAFREELYSKAENEGPMSVYKIILELDPEGAKEIHPNNVIRVVRAIELFHQTGKPKSDNMAISKSAEQPYDALYLALGVRDRSFLYERINLRVLKLMEAVLLEGTKTLMDMVFGLTSSRISD